MKVTGKPQGEVLRTLGFVLLTFLWPGKAAAQTPVPQASIEQRLDEQVPLDLVFRNETGRQVTLQEYFGSKPVIVVLAQYRCPRLCSLVLNSLTESLRRIDYRIGKEFTVVTVSFDPREKPDLAAAKKQAYVEQYGGPEAAAGWHFLTGDEEAIERLADALGFRYVYDVKSDQYAHASGIMILTPTGKIARYFHGLEYSPRDLRYGLEDASAGNVGSPVASPLRMLCFAYDPAAGKYTLMTIRLVRIAGLVTIALLGGCLLRAWRKERSRRAEPREGPEPAALILRPLTGHDSPVHGEKP